MIFKTLFLDDSTRYLNGKKSIVNDILSREEACQKIPDLSEQVLSLKEKVHQGEYVMTFLPEMYALVREAAFRTLAMKHFNVQLLGGIALHEGNVAEMRTGEGKTLVATLPASLNALKGKGVHIITVNDYLARRDAVWMGQVYAQLGFSVGVVNSQEQSYMYDPGHKEKDEERDALGSYKVVYDFLRPCTRKEAYEADITYGTNNEVVFDFLRDNIIYESEKIRQRGFEFAIVDEVDSILIDEARSPLIISAPLTAPEEGYQQFAHIAKTLTREDDYTVEEKYKSISLTQEGIGKIEKTLGVDNFYKPGNDRAIHSVLTALKAKEIYTADKEYVISSNGEIVIVDEFTGRLQPGRRWRDGLHQAIEAKEGVTVHQESQTVASITFQNYFRMYNTLSGMTGTAQTSAEEFYKVYGAPVIQIPTHIPSKRIDNEDLIYTTKQGKHAVIVKTIQEKYEKKQPVLVGTAAIEENEILSDLLKKKQIPHKVLNAKNHEQEGEIIAQAGALGAVTIATNLAGRGVDIKLGGIPESEKDKEEVKKKGGLFVIGTTRNDARRIDDQLRGRSGRQGDIGETQFFVSFDDHMLKVFGGAFLKTMIEKLNLPEETPIQRRSISKAIESAQRKIEGSNFDARRWSLEFDTVVNNQRDLVYTKRNHILTEKDTTMHLTHFFRKKKKKKEKR